MRQLDHLAEERVARKTARDRRAKKSRKGPVEGVANGKVCRAAVRTSSDMDWDQ